MLCAAVRLGIGGCPLTRSCVRPFSAAHARVKMHKLTYFGHTCRPSGCELVRGVMFGVVDGKRKRGRPKISFADNIVSWTGMSLHENCQLASDRDAW